jgi:hypothetical protein
MSIGPAGPAYKSGGDYGGTYSTRDELDFLDGLGRWRVPSWTPADAVSPRAYRVACLMGYLGCFEARAIRGSVDWVAVRAHAIALLGVAKQEAA